MDDCISEYPRDTEFLVAILDLSMFLEIEDGITYAIKGFESRPDFHPALQLELARCHRIDHWIEPAFRQLISMPALTLSLDNVIRIGIVAFHYLVQTKSCIKQLKKGIAYHPPDQWPRLQLPPPL